LPHKLQKGKKCDKIREKEKMEGEKMGEQERGNYREYGEMEIGDKRVSKRL